MPLLFFIIPISYLLLLVFSYFWVDFNLTLISWEPISQFLERFQHLGYFNRPLFSRFYLIIVILLVLIQIYLLFSRFIYKTSLKKLLLLAGAVILISCLAYPFLSYDIFSYLFDAKIIWYYQENPYLFAPDHFSSDPWLRFMRWTHRVAPYGPIWLIYSLLPAVFSFGRFILNFYGLKLLGGLVFFISGWLLLKISKQDRKVFAYWFFNPFLLIELLVNSHNDLLMIGLFFVALFFSQQKKLILTTLAFLASLGVKFMSGLAWPLIFFKNKPFWATMFVFFGLLGFAWQINRFQPWYFTWLFLAFPLMKMTTFSWLVVFVFQFFLLVLKYQPFLASGSWEGTGFFVFFRALFVSLALFFLFLLPKLQGLLFKFFRLHQ